MRILALLALAFVGAWPVAVSAQTIKVGAVVPLTGRYGAGGAQVRAGYEIAVEQVNAAGGVTVGGKKMPLELVLLDDESDATKTVSRLETLAAQGVVAYLGGVRLRSPRRGRLGGREEQGPVPRRRLRPQQDPPAGLPLPLLAVLEVARHRPAARRRCSTSIPAAERPKRVAIFQEKTDWGREMAAAWAEAGKGAGYEVVVSGEYAPGAKDFSDLILKAKAANADAVFALPDAARRHDDGQADEGARLHARSSPSSSARPDAAGLVARTSARTATTSCSRPAGTTR